MGKKCFLNWKRYVKFRFGLFCRIKQYLEKQTENKVV